MEEGGPRGAGIPETEVNANLVPFPISELGFLGFPVRVQSRIEDRGAGWVKLLRPELRSILGTKEGKKGNAGDVPMYPRHAPGRSMSLPFAGWTEPERECRGRISQDEDPQVLGDPVLAIEHGYLGIKDSGWLLIRLAGISRGWLSVNPTLLRVHIRHGFAFQPSEPPRDAGVLSARSSSVVCRCASVTQTSEQVLLLVRSRGPLPRPSLSHVSAPLPGS